MKTIPKITIQCPNGSFDCNPFCRLCEGNDETTLSELLDQADSIAWDKCHKIFINMDSSQTQKMREYGYSNIISDDPDRMEKILWQWFEDSCYLRMVDAVFTNQDGTDKFVSVIAQFEIDYEGVDND